jgi:hypothetical protein
MKNAVFWDVAPHRSCVNGRFRRMYHLHLQGRQIRERGTSANGWQQSAQKMEAIRSSETSIHTRCTRRHTPEGGILLSINVLNKSAALYIQFNNYELFFKNSQTNF